MALRKKKRAKLVRNPCPLSARAPRCVWREPAWGELAVFLGLCSEKWKATNPDIFGS